MDKFGAPYRGTVAVQVYLQRCRVCGPWTIACPHDSDDVTEVELEVRAQVWSYPGKLYGPPECCYPPESGFEVTGASVGGWSCEGGLPAGLTDGEVEFIEEEVGRAEWDNDGPDPDGLYGEVL